MTDITLTREMTVNSRKTIRTKHANRQGRQFIIPCSVFDIRCSEKYTTLNTQCSIFIDTYPWDRPSLKTLAQLCYRTLHHSIFVNLLPKYQTKKLLLY